MNSGEGQCFVGLRGRQKGKGGEGALVRIVVFVWGLGFFGYSVIVHYSSFLRDTHVVLPSWPSRLEGSKLPSMKKP